MRTILVLCKAQSSCEDRGSTLTTNRRRCRTTESKDGVTASLAEVQGGMDIDNFHDRNIQAFVTKTIEENGFQIKDGSSCHPDGP